MAQEDQTVRLDLNDDERHLLFYGLVDWFGPAKCTEALAVALGFTGLDDLEREGHRIAHDIHDGRAVSVRDWTRALFSAEIIFGSNVLGTGDEWCVIHGGDDAHWLRVLRGLERKVPTSRQHLGDSETPELPEDDFDPGPGEWVLTDDDGKIIDRFVDFMERERK